VPWYATPDREVSIGAVEAMKTWRRSTFEEELLAAGEELVAFDRYRRY
jgi:hypothetical protein